MEKIHGLIDAPFTPFYENGEVNYEPIEAYCQLLVRNGLQGVFINGSSGEGYMLTEDERMKLAERWMEVAPEGFKVIVHVGSTCVKSSKRLAEHAQKIGAWGIGAMAPVTKYIHIHIIPIINVHIKSRTAISRLGWYLIIKIQHQMHITDMPRYRDIMHLVAHVLFQYRHAA